jgi:transposase
MESVTESGHDVCMDAGNGPSNESLGENGTIRKGNRRRWSEQERRRIVEETLAPGASVARVARLHGVNANQVFSWRKLYRRSEPGTALLAVKITEPQERPRNAALGVAGAGASGSGVIHITVGKAQIRIEGDVDREALRLVLKSVLR